MPIEGFVRKRLPRLGKIRLGERTKNKQGKEYPRDLEYFAVPPEVAEKLGTDRPTELTVFLPSLDVEEFFPVFLKRYGTGERLLCKGNGETANCIDEKTGEMVEIECAYRDCPYYQDKKCTEVGNLMVMLPDVNIAGVYQIDTGSRYGIQNVLNAAEMFLRMAHSLMPDPRAALFTPLKLVRELQKVQYIDPKTNQPQTVDKWILNLRVPGLTFEEAKQTLTEGVRLKALDAGAIPELPEGDDEDESDAVEGTVLPDADEDMPTDLYPDAAQPAATIEQKKRFATAQNALLQEFGVEPAVSEKKFCQDATKGQTATFGDLSETEAEHVITRAEKLLEGYRSGEIARGPKKDKKADQPNDEAPPANDTAPAPNGDGPGPDEGQVKAWDALVQSVQSAKPGIDMTDFEAAACDGKPFRRLNPDEAKAALSMGAEMVQRWQTEQETAKGTQTTPAAPEPQAEAPQAEDAPAEQAASLNFDEE